MKYLFVSLLFITTSAVAQTNNEYACLSLDGSMRSWPRITTASTMSINYPLSLDKEISTAPFYIGAQQRFASLSTQPESTLVWKDQADGMSLPILSSSYSKGDILKSCESVFLNSAVNVETPTKIRFATYSITNETVYKSKNEIGEFIFSTSLLDEESDEWNVSSLRFSGTLSPNVSATEGNGGIQVERGVYQTNWFGTGQLAYANLIAPTAISPALFNLNVAGNLADNQEGFFSVSGADGNTFISGTSSNSTAIVGFKNISGTSLNLNAATINSSGYVTVNGLTSTSLTVSDAEINTLGRDRSVFASFSSQNPSGTVIQISNVSNATDAFAGFSLTQGNVTARILSYSSQYTTGSLNAGLVVETNNSYGMTFSVTPNSEEYAHAPSFRYIINNREIVTISTQSVTIANAIKLGGVTDDDMFAMESVPGTLIYNITRDKLVFCNGKEWNEIEMKPIKRKQNRSL